MKMKGFSPSSGYMKSSDIGISEGLPPGPRKSFALNLLGAYSIPYTTAGLCNDLFSLHWLPSVPNFI